VVLSGGGAIKGTIASEDDKFLVLRTAYGTITLDMSDISEVRYSTADEKKILAELAAVEPSNINGRLRLARRASSGGLDETAKRIYAEILAVDPDEKTARKALGYVRIGNEWITASDSGPREGMVPYKGRWVTPEERDSLLANDKDRRYFAEFGLTPSDGYRILDAVADFNVAVEQRGGFIVRKHVRTYEVKDKPYVYSVDALTWKRLGAFVAVSFIDRTRRRMPGFGELEITVYGVKVDALGNRKPGASLVTEKVNINPDMWNKKSDFTYWDTKINHSSYEEHASEEFKAQWNENYLMNCDGVLYVLANRDAALLAPPGVFYVEAVFRMGDKEKKVGRYVQYAQAK
jgi:hypothetical protein